MNEDSCANLLGRTRKYIPNISPQLSTPASLIALVTSSRDLKLSASAMMISEIGETQSLPSMYDGSLLYSGRSGLKEKITA